MEAAPRARGAQPAPQQVVHVRSPAREPASTSCSSTTRRRASGGGSSRGRNRCAVRTRLRPPISKSPSTVRRRPRAGAVSSAASPGRLARFVVIRVTDELMAKGAQRVAELFEQRYRKGGLRSFTSADYQVAKPDEADQLRGPDLERLGAQVPRCCSSTGRWRWRTPASSECRRRCSSGARAHTRIAIWAYDHHTLSKTPAQNANRPRRPFAPAERAAPRRRRRRAQPWRPGRRAELAELQARGSLIEVRSVLFVATPNGGTPLCDPEHLQRLVDRYTNLFAFGARQPRHRHHRRVVVGRGRRRAAGGRWTRRARGDGSERPLPEGARESEGA